MFWLLFSFGVARGRPLASQCLVVPAGSNYTDNNGYNHTTIDPVVCNKCMIETDQEGHYHAYQVNCTSGASKAEYEEYHQSYTCDGTPSGSNTITVNGTCTSMGCASFDRYEYNDPSCTGVPVNNHTNEYIYWMPDKCMYNATQTCVNGEPQMSFYNNSMCSGNAMNTVTATGTCVRHGNGKASENVTAVDNPCST